MNQSAPSTQLPGNCLGTALRALLSGLAAMLLVGLPQPLQAHAQTIGPDGTPQVDAATERVGYVDAAASQLMTHYWVVFYGVDQLPQYPSPDQAKGTDLRKRVLDLRLIMDLNAYAYEPHAFEAFRDAVDQAYERIGTYKDLFDVQAIDGLPIDPLLQTARLARMNIALAPFRAQPFRDDLKNFIYNRVNAPLALVEKDQPRLWQIAQIGPSTALDSAGNAALLGTYVLRNLRNQGLLIGDIVDPVQEAHFHDIRKAMRSVLVLADMFPSLTASVAEFRDPLAKLVKAYGQTNDQFTAYHEAQLAGRDLGPRIDALRASYARTEEMAVQFANSGQLDEYANALNHAADQHRR